MKVEAGYLARLAAEQHSDRVAVSQDGTQTSFAALNAAANRVGSALASKGLRGERVGVLAHNRQELVEAWLGMEKHAVVRVVLHSHFDMAAHVHALNAVGARGLVFDTRFTAAVAEAREALPGVRHYIAIGEHCPDWATPYSELLTSGSPDERYLSVDENAPCFLQLTSGTTGRPKAWTKTYRSWQAVINQNLHHLDTFGGAPPIGTSDVNLHFHPLQWASGFQTLYPYLVRGARTVLMDDMSFDAGQFIDTLQAEKVTGTLMPAPMLTPVLDEVASRGGLEHSMRRLVIFFATPDQLTRTTELLGPVWCHGFGSTEQGAVTTRLLAGEAAADDSRMNSVGRVASPLIEVAIVNSAGERLPTGEVGEIVVRSAMSDGYYWDDEEATRAAYHADDWFRPQDVGYLDADGFLYYADRASDAIELDGGLVVYPHLVEAAVLRHPAVANCGVVTLGDGAARRIVAAVQLKGRVQDDLELPKLILKSCRDSLPQESWPQQIVVLAELPTVLGGAKVQRAALREQLAARA
jgi:acyl-CoA synthetase (AMP-forming)/AMP-acid ligase II